MNRLEDFVTPTQEELFAILRKTYSGNCRYVDGGFILVIGEAPIMLLAHLDTVHKEPVKQICETQNGNILMSPQGIGGDDRCGVYALVTAYKRAKKKPWLLFTCDEETGGKGASKFCDTHAQGLEKLCPELDELKMLIEVDRKGANDAVYYDCANDEFEKYITSKGFKTETGSFSDISYVAPELGVAAVNLSSGYYNAHTLHEYINRKQLNNTVKKVLDIIDDVSDPDFPKYEYVEAPRQCYWQRAKGLEFGSFDDVENYSKWREDQIKEMQLAGVHEGLIPIYFDFIDYGYYDLDELEDFRNKYGVTALIDMYHQEFGYGADEPDETDDIADYLDDSKEQAANDEPFW